MKKLFFLSSFLLLVLLITPILTQADADDAFGNIKVTVPTKDQTVGQDGSLSVTWNTTNKTISRLLTKKAQVFFRITLLEDCSQNSSCQQQKYQLEASKTYKKSSNSSYTYSTSSLPAQLTTSGRYRVAVCYLVYANQNLTKVLARTRCGASASFNLSIPTSPAVPETPPVTPPENYDQTQDQNNYYNQVADQPVAPTDGQCGSAAGVDTFNPDQSSLCAAGTSAFLSKNTDTNKWTWACQGTTGGVIAQCEAGALSSTCTDSDSGKNYGQASQITGLGDQGQSIDASDQCDSSDDLGKRLIENYCNGNLSATEQYTCANGCYKGACLPNPSIDYDAKIVSQGDFPTLLTTNQVLTYTVRIKNTGKKSWLTSEGVKLGSQAPQDNLNWGNVEHLIHNGQKSDVSRMPLPRSEIKPGEDAIFSNNVRASTTAGVYSLQWKMVKEWVGWFGDLTPSVTVTVNPNQSLSSRLLANIFSIFKRLFNL